MNRIVAALMIGLGLIGCTVEFSSRPVGVVKSKGMDTVKTYSPVTHTYTKKIHYWVIVEDGRKFYVYKDEHFLINLGDTLKVRITCQE